MYENGNMSPADMAAVVGNNNDGFGFGGNGAWWIFILFLFAMNNGWGNGFGGNGAGAGMQRGFDQQAVMSGIGDISGAIGNGFANVQTALCNGFAGVNAGVANGFAQSEISNNSRQMANMNQLFSIQTGLGNQLNSLSMGLQNCCCENRAATADLKYTVANEACADRAAVDGALRDVTAQGVANTQALMNTVNAGFQSIKDQMCNDKIDAKNERIAELERQLTMANLAASQGAQTAQILANNEAQTAALERYLAPNPIPAYIVQSPYCYPNQGYGWGGCGCNRVA